MVNDGLVVKGRSRSNDGSYRVQPGNVSVEPIMMRGGEE